MSTLAQAIRMESPDTIPVSVGMLPAAWMKYGSELQRLVDQYPQFFHGLKMDLSKVEENLPASYRKGVYFDEWGCEWHNEHAGNESIVVKHPVHTEQDVFDLKIPSCRDGRLPHGFMYLRLLDLAGFENAMVWFAEEDEVIETLIDKVLEYNIYQVAAVLNRMDEIIYFGDDLGMQKGLAIGVRRWRKYLKPCFRKLYGMIKAYKPDQLIYMHTDGCIWEIMPDLIECGVDIINPQYRAGQPRARVPQGARHPHQSRPGQAAVPGRHALAALRPRGRMRGEPVPEGRRAGAERRTQLRDPARKHGRRAGRGRKIPLLQGLSAFSSPAGSA